MELAADVGPGPMQVAAILVLQDGSALQPVAVRGALDARVRRIPRLRQRLVRVPPGCGRPIWVDDPHFDIDQHVRCVPCPALGDERALLAVAAEAATRRLLPDRPLWAATLVTGLAAGLAAGLAGARAALIVVFHHVLADGIGGLAVLAQLVDGAPAASQAAFPQLTGAAGSAAPEQAAQRQ